MLTREAWNALLKILEEPPPGVVFVFATTEPQKIAQQAAPVLSRLQRFDFRRLGTAAIRDRLRAVLEAERIEADDDALTLIARQADGGMRDALSVLDQCLSFGEGRVTAERVRQILGLVADDVYADLLEVVATRNPAGVFPLLDRLEEAGADLIEFLGGAGEVLRTLLMLQLGATPEGLTESRLQALEQFRDRLAAEDLLRMLKMLSEAEAGVRRSANLRLAIETLLLRWTLMDRTVDLESILGGSTARRLAGSGGPSSPSAQGEPAAASRPAAEPPSRREEPPSRRAAAEVPRVEFSLDGLRQAWPDLVAAARDQSRFLGEALAAARPVSAQAPALSLAVPDGNPIHLEALGRQRDALEQLLGRVVGGPVHITLTEAQEGEGGGSPRARRLSDAEARAERLKALKSRDPALEAAADSLDLEVLE